MERKTNETARDSDSDGRSADRQPSLLDTGESPRERPLGGGMPAKERSDGSPTATIKETIKETIAESTAEQRTRSDSAPASPIETGGERNDEAETTTARAHVGAGEGRGGAQRQLVRHEADRTELGGCLQSENAFHFETKARDAGDVGVGRRNGGK